MERIENESVRRVKKNNKLFNNFLREIVFASVLSTGLNEHGRTFHGDVEGIIDEKMSKRLRKIYIKINGKTIRIEGNGRLLLNIARREV